MKLKTAKIVGTAKEKNWTQVHVFEPEDEEKRSKRGQLLAVISFKDLQPGLAVTEAGKEIISRLHEEYFGQIEEKPFSQLKKAVEKVWQESLAEVQLELIVACLVDKVLSLAVVGGGRILLKRQGKIISLVEGQKEKLQTASGYLQDKDLILLGSAGFFSNLDSQVNQIILQNESLDLISESLAPLIHEQEDSSLSAAILGQLEESENKVENKKAKKTTFALGLILLVILGLGFIFGSWQRKHLGQKEKRGRILAEAQQKKKEAEAILATDTVKAKKLLLQAQSLLEGLEKEKIADSSSDQLKQELGGILATIVKEYQAEPKLFYDLQLIKDEAQGTDFYLTDSQLAVLDQSKKAVYQLNIDDKKSAIVAGGEFLAEANQIAASQIKILILAKDGFFEVNKESKKTELAIKRDEQWQEVVDLGIFNENLYLLSKEMIWQYPALSQATDSAQLTQFGEKKAWLESKIDLNKVVSLAIDGVIWVLNSDGTILKLSRGAKEDFSIFGLEKSFSNPKAIFTDENQKNLYILDNGNSRVVVLDKSGKYQGQYFDPSIGQAAGMVAFEKAAKIFLLNGSKISEIDLK